MRPRLLVVLVWGGLLVAAPSANAQSAPPAAPRVDRAARAPEPAASPEKATDAYCRWVRAAAASESDPFLLPTAYASGGIISGSDAAEGASALPPTQRVIAGAVYSFGATGLNRGLALRDAADAECKRYGAESLLRAFVEQHKDPFSQRALAARAKVLDDSLARAAEILAAQRARLAQSRTTIEEVDATQLRVDSLRSLASEAHAQSESLASIPSMPVQSIRELLARHDEAEERAERGAAWVRQSHGWDLSVRGGYDRIFGARDYTPLFAMATATLSFGWLLQGGNDRAAESARREWAHAEVLGIDDRVAQVTQMLRATSAAEAARLRESRILLADLETRFKQVGSMEGERARGYAESVWFDLVRVRAEHTYLEEHVRELATVLGEPQPQP